MVDLLKTGSDFLSDQLKSFASKTVSIRRGANTTTGVSATIGKTEFEIDDSAGVIKIESRDFLIDAADYKISSAETLPERGDTIIETVGSDVYTYEVMANAAIPHWSYSDPYRKKLRVHTKQISVA